MRAMPSNKRHSAMCLACAVALTACSGPMRETSQAAETGAVSDTAPSTAAQASDLSLNEQIGISIGDLAQQLGIEEQAISIEAVRRVNWRSGALGCPKPGMSYTQALVPGVLILLKVGATPYGYHARINGTPFFCPLDRVEKPASVTAEDMA